ncbi:hypothetical protein MKUB_23190 [Mycobacterium kubicae]|uniref:Uncharacterized protein n=1 Tax=Mycobacterium kubicae TaxID=120959 RepID=A0ABQ1BM95_9MYCO|nr:hypothetical protein MKUB_23190 [Mycobacterium kubicae]
MVKYDIIGSLDTPDGNKGESGSLARQSVNRKEIARFVIGAPAGGPLVGQGVSNAESAFLAFSVRPWRPITAYRCLDAHSDALWHSRSRGRARRPAEQRWRADIGDY